MNLKDLWKRDENQSMKGWDFSHIDDRWHVEELPFDYKKVVMTYLKDQDTLLDMGTGGGEFLLSLNHPYAKTYATEGYKPNLDYCMEKLTPLGVEVKGIRRDGKIPFDDDQFDVIINKHSTFDIEEVKRVLKKDGIFITQQIGALNNQELSRRFIKDFELPSKASHLHIQEEAFRKHGFDIVDGVEYFPSQKFYDIGALVFFCKIIVWEFPDFSVDKYYDQLVNLHTECEGKGYIESKEHRYLMVCKNVRKD